MWENIISDVRAELKTIPGFENLGTKEMRDQIDAYIQDVIQILRVIAEKPEDAARFKNDLAICRNRLNGVKQLAIAKTERYLMNLILSKIPAAVLPEPIRKIIF